ncbi:hypothetical protein [Streptomyces sp. NA03103]|uniref:hypothetical protein n=1 Tax=Streptomyces sp. NA03103 TaxID=2742134 RepID=UPI0020CB5649|nr:hypothetical protein [Streptomyces sp. NA03103]
MQSDDKPTNGQHNPNFLDLLNQTPPPPDARHRPRPKRLARLRAAWRKSWKEGGFFYQRWEEIPGPARRMARDRRVDQNGRAARRAQPHRDDGRRRR